VAERVPVPETGEDGRISRRGREEGSRPKNRVPDLEKHTTGEGDAGAISKCDS